MSEPAKSKAHRLRRLAVQITQQLPENKTDAILTLELARELVEWESNGELARDGLSVAVG